MVSLHANDLGRSEGREAVHECDADLDFGGLSVWVSGADAFAAGFEAAHLGFNATSGVVSGPSLPERSPIVSRGAQGLVAGFGRRAVLFPKAPVLSDRNDGGGLTFDDGGVAAAGVVGAIGGHGADLLVLRDLVEQFGQDGAVAVAAGGEFHSPDVRRGRIHRRWTWRH